MKIKKPWDSADGYVPPGLSLSEGDPLARRRGMAARALARLPQQEEAVYFALPLGYVPFYHLGN